MFDALHLQLALRSSGEYLQSAGPTTNWEDIYVTLASPTKLKKGERVKLIVDSVYEDDACEYVVQVEEPKRAACTLKFNSAVSSHAQSALACDAKRCVLRDGLHLEPQDLHSIQLG